MVEACDFQIAFVAMLMGYKSVYVLKYSL